MVDIPHCTPGTSQRVLADRPLAQLHTSQRSEHSGDLPYRNAHSIVEHVGRRHHSSPYPVRAGPVLVRRNIGMPPSDLLTAGPAPTYLHPVPRHLGSGNRRNVGCADNPHSLMLESASTCGAGVLSHRHLYKRLGDFIGRRRLSVAERPHTRLAAGTLGSAASPTLGERSRLALSCSLELGDLLVQLFLGRRQLRNLPLQLRDQPHQLVTLTGREVFGLTHSQSIKTCSVPHNPPTDTDPANQLPKSLDWHRPTVSEIEAGRRRVSAEELTTLAEVYGVNVPWIVGEEDEDSSLAADRVKLAARELGKLREEDLDRVLRLVQALRASKGATE